LHKIIFVEVQLGLVETLWCHTMDENPESDTNGRR
jgi:hypothetical protein